MLGGDRMMLKSIAGLTYFVLGPASVAHVDSQFIPVPESASMFLLGIGLLYIAWELGKASPSKEL